MTEAAAIQFGTVVATGLSALTVILAFLRPATRYFRCVARGGFCPYGDGLCAGIWLSAVGASVLAASAMVRLTTGIVFPLVAALGWAIIGAGYFLHFIAWRSSFRGDVPGGEFFHFRWLFILLTLGTGSGVTAYLLTRG